MTAELTTGEGAVSGPNDGPVKDLLAVAHDANDSIMGKLDAAGASLDKTRTAMNEKLRYAAASGSDYVKLNPWKMIGLATAVGVIVGILSYRR